jgi:hypothetical protein
MRSALKIFAFLLFVICHSSFVTAQPISIALKDSTRGTIRTDSANWEEAWIEIDGAAPRVKMLEPKDLSVRLGARTAEILSVDSIGATYQTQLALSVVLDNSGSMFHSYDSLTKYCDSLVDSLPRGVRYQAVTFDDFLRNSTNLPTNRENLYIAQTGFRDSAKIIQAFWHYYDSVRTQYTPLYDAIAAALQNIDGRRLLLLDSLADVMLVVTDGEDNASRTRIESLREMFDALKIRLYAINYRTEDARLEWLVTHTGGHYYVAENIADLREDLKSIGKLLTRQYHVRYRFQRLGPSGTPRTKGR